ncbi:MAG: hypothetical protein OXB88_07745 [Bacteriovoracales bacterium]|nr:hypothetical protein [Bacteriovoracales bacterium]
MYQSICLLSVLFITVGCKNPTAGMGGSEIKRGWDGLEKLDDIENLSLVSPASSPHENKTPTIRISGLKADDLVQIYTDAQCSDLLMEKKADAQTIDILLPTLTTGQHRFYARRSWSQRGIFSDCSQHFLLYEVTSDDPLINGLAHDTTVKKTKTWSWSCSGTMPPCTYRFLVDTNPNSTPLGSFGHATSTTQGSGTGTYYLHIQAKDQGGKLSSLLHFSAQLDSRGPQALSLTPPQDDLYTLGEHIDLTLNFDENVTVTGTPRLALTVGSATRYASYLSGSGTSGLTFRYTVQNADDDADGIVLSPTIDLNSGTLRDSLGNSATPTFTAPSLTNVKVDTIPPSLSGLSNDSVAKRNKTWSWSCSETCTYRFLIDTTPNTNPTGSYGSTTTASKSSGTGTYYLHVQAQDSAGNESTVVHVQAVLDNSGPTPSSMAAPSGGTYNLAQDMDFTVTFNENVTVTGTPRLALTVGSVTRQATYHSGSTTSTLTFRYGTQSGDDDADGIALASTSIDLNSGTLKDSLGNDAHLNFSSLVPNLSGVKVDAVPPSLSGLSNDSVAKRNKTWSWSCSETCTYRFLIDTTPTTNPTGNYGNMNSASQTSGSGTHYLHVQAKDSAGNESAVSHISAVLDNTGPSISSVNAPADGAYRISQNLDFTVNFDGDVTVTGNPRLSLTVGSTTRYASYTSGTGTQALVFRYTVQGGDDDADGIALASTSIDLNSGTLKDSLGNDASLDFSSVAPSLTTVTIDTAPPTLTGLADDTTYKQSKSWGWGCSETCTYRFTVDTSASTLPSGSYAGTNSASQGSGTGTYYLHVQARDGAGNESTVSHVSALLDNTAPNFSGTPTVSDDATGIQATAITWTSMTIEDPHSGVDKIQIAVGQDQDNSGSLSDAEKSNVVSWTDIPSGSSLDPKTYRIVNGNDGFTISLDSSVEYYTSLRIQDGAQNTSAVITSGAWQRLFIPTDLTELILWFDSDDLETLYTDSSCSTPVTSDNDAVACWEDKSNSDNRATQSTTASVPAYSADSRSVSFDGSNDWMPISSDTGFPYGSDAKSIFTLHLTNNTDSSPRKFFSYGTTSTNNSNSIGQYSTICVFSGYNVVVNFTSCVTADEWDIGSYLFDGITASLYIHGDMKASADRASWNILASDPSIQRIGRQITNTDEFWNGEIREIMMFDTNLNDTNREKVEGYLACKWGLQSELPSGHTYRNSCPH